MVVKDRTRHSSAISAVLPLALSRRGGMGDLKRCDILFSSLSHFAKRNLFEQILVVVPSKDRRSISDCIMRSKNLPLVIVDENEILPQFKEFPEVGGWYRQQIIKLFAANMVNTEFYLTLDSDVVLCKPLGLDQLLIDGRALIEPLARSFYPRWWPGSAELLGLINDPEAPGMSITPALLSATVCRQLFQDIGERFNRDWAYVLLEKAHAHLRDPGTVLGWTEYTLYYLTLEHHGVFDQFHFRPKVGDQRLLCSESVWYPDDVKTLNMSAYFERKNVGIFAVFQSTSGLPIRRLKNEVQKYFMITSLPLNRRLARVRWQLGTVTGVGNIAWKILNRLPKVFQRFVIWALAGALKGSK